MKPQTIVLTGEPKSTQHLYRNTCRGGFSTTYMTAEGKALKEAYQWEAKAQWKGKPLTGDVSLSITLFFGTKRRADLDNFNKLSLDALTGIAYEDDSQIAELTLKRGYDKQLPRIELTVSQTGGYVRISILLLSLLTTCAYAPPASQVAPESEVGGTGNIQFSLKTLNPTTHMLTVRVSPGLLETESSMSQRMLAFATEQAAKTCPKRFDFVADPNPDLLTDGLTLRNKVYTFRCS